MSIQFEKNVYKPDFQTSFVPTVDKAVLSPFFADTKNNYCILPGFCDVHVHFREPGFS